VFRLFAEASRGRGMLDGLDPDVFGTAPGMIAVSFDARPYMDRKLSALAAHRSAFGVTLETLKKSPAWRSADVARVSSGDGARSVPPRRCARCRSSMAVAGLL
jgi:LmbE family N-acetylglucosaminyl deacetylase